MSTRFVQIADPHHAELRGEARIRRHAGIGGADILRPPVVVHLVDLVDRG
jgi:hypothetical protein